MTLNIILVSIQMCCGNTAQRCSVFGVPNYNLYIFQLNNDNKYMMMKY